ncbi:MAG: carbamoyl-phosphate synthase domain-containing protein, partial [Anaerovorax sp.]
KSKGKIITQTFPLVGNYGLNDEDYTSDRVWAKGYIVREWCEEPSNFRSKYTIDEFLEKHNTVGISNIDTRSLTKKIRDAGTLKGAIVAELPADLNQLISEIKNETGEAE